MVVSDDVELSVGVIVTVLSSDSDVSVIGRLRLGRSKSLNCDLY